ncbi:MAG TPA: ComEA family DNA-binding protein [Steroidobacteraceae bacterium]
MRMLTFPIVLASLMPLLAFAGPVNINTADANTLARELKGIGPSRAQAIVAYRTEHGPFKSPDDLALVKGIPQKVIDDNRDNIRVETTRAAVPAPARGPSAPAAKTP